MQPAAAREAELGRYELLCLLAMGGMASVHLARAAGIGGFEKLVVIKRILPHAAKDQHFIEMFLDEARIAATLEHANVVQVFDVGSVNGDVFLAMEFLHGHDVRNIVRSVGDKPLPLHATLAIMIGVCAGLHYAHERRGPKGQLLDVVHRDVSPSNVVVTYDGSVKVIDFGIAKATNRLGETTHGAIKGKPGYMSPEQVLGEPLDRRSDIFCVGIMLYELTTGTRLFGPKHAESLRLRAIIEGNVTPPSKLVPTYPPELEKIVQKALGKEPKERYATALDLQRALEAFALASRSDISPSRLASFMNETFEDELEKWHAAEQSGVSLAEHVVRGSQARLPPSPDGVATKTEGRRSGVNEYAPTMKALYRPETPAPPNRGGEARRGGAWRTIGLALVIAVLLAAGVVGGIVWQRHRPETPVLAIAPTNSALLPTTSVAIVSPSGAPSEAPVEQAPSVSSAAPVVSARHRYSGAAVYVSGVFFTACMSPFWDTDAYSKQLKALPFTQCFTDARFDPPLHENPDYDIQATGNDYTSIVAKDGSPKLDACIEAKIRTIPLLRPAGAGACQMHLGLSARCFAGHRPFRPTECP